ncbi:hypothetical protein C8Q77DRAFT_1065736 [Trametes polyzona]|nr:hypothetical protein C8Q77DRAFT_1065736 [Trametes polyzona]
MSTSSEILHSPKIRFVILEHLSPGPYPGGDALSSDSPEIKQRRESQRALARLALLNRSLSGDVLDVLWRYIDDISYVLHALKAYSPKQHILTDTITKTDWERFQGYASRVRELRVGDVAVIHPSVWVILARWCMHAPLLPKLERLIGLTIDTSSLACITLLVSESLRGIKLHIPGPAEESIVNMAILAIKPCFDSLTSLVVDDQAAVHSGRPNAVRFWELSGLETLRVLHKIALTAPTVQALAAFSHLRTLQLALSKMPPVDEKAIRSGFPNLRELELSDSIYAISAFLTATAPAKLESLAITSPNLCTQANTSYEIPGSFEYKKEVLELKPIYAVLTPALRRFCARFSCTSGCAIRSHLSDSSVLLPGLLRAAPALQDISFVFQDTNFRVADEVLLALADGWPELTSLELATRKSPPPAAARGRSSPDNISIHIRRYSYSPDRRPYAPRYDPSPPRFAPLPRHPSVKTVAIFAHGHPRLTRLVLPSLDLRAHPDLATVPALNSSLRQLEFCALERGVPLFEYALALDLLFPRLDLAGAEALIPADGRSAPADAGGRGASAEGDEECDRTAELRLLLRALQEGRAGTYRNRHSGNMGGGGAEARSDALDGGTHAIRLILETEDPKPDSVPEGTRTESSRSPHYPAYRTRSPSTRSPSTRRSPSPY